MMIVLLLLGALGCMGVSRVTGVVKKYGESYYFMLHGNPHVLEFHPEHNSNVTILWKKDQRVITLDRKFVMTGSIFAIHKLTQNDSGHYISRDKDLKEISTYTLEVKATTRTYSPEPGDRLSFTFNLKPDSCNIYFFPSRTRRLRMLENKIIRGGVLQGDSDELYCKGFDFLHPCGISNKVLQISCDGRYEIRDQNDNTALMVSLDMNQILRTVIRTPGYNFNFTFNLEPNSCNIYFRPEGDSVINLVYGGVLQEGLDEIGCSGFELLKPCGVLNKVVQMSCNGRYEIRDQNDNTGFVVTLEMEPQPYSLPGLSIGVGVLSMFLCCCCKICCCGKKKSQEEPTETAAAEPEVQYQRRYNEPCGPSSDQLIEPSGTNCFNQPSSAPSDSLVLPDAQQPAAPSLPVHHDPEPKFEFKGVTFPCAPPLESDSSRCDVYTSDKLNFL
ncbi:uncharacterized protein LOC144382920 isoform X2 [Gasterosteus aculeatus]